jgi:RNase adaptor protein for sRNA GlmZ degradation
MLPEPEYEPELPHDRGEDTEVHRFTVHRGMAIALVIETRDWYSGLLQAAMARVRVEGQN